MAAILVKALEAEGAELGEEDTVEVTFEPVEMVSLHEKYAAAAQARAAGVPDKQIWREILGWGPDKIAQAELDRADSIISAGVFAANNTDGDNA